MGGGLGTAVSAWSEFVRLRRVALAGAVGLFAFYAGCVFLLRTTCPVWLEGSVWILRNLYIWWMLSAILGYARLVSRSSVPLAALGERSRLSWYVLHQSLIIACAFWLLPCTWAGGRTDTRAGGNDRWLRAAARADPPQRRCCARCSD
jgi:hypothetical protein